MKSHSILILILLIVFVVADADAQSNRSTDAITRPRTVSGTQLRAHARFQEPAKQTQTPEVSSSQRDDSGSSRRLSPGRIRARIDQAERLLKARPVPTVMTSTLLDRVTLAALLPE